MIAALLDLLRRLLGRRRYADVDVDLVPADCEDCGGPLECCDHDYDPSVFYDYDDYGYSDVNR